MDNWQPSTLSWSFSRKTHFDSCRRHYFYHRFWGQDPRTRWRFFEMRNITTLMMLRGQVAHTVIADALNAARLGSSYSLKTAKQNFTQIIREKFMQSAKRMWHIDNRPQGRKTSEFTNLLEHYYKFPDINERAKAAQKTGWACLDNLMESDFWTEIANSDASNWQEVEPEGFPSFNLDGIQVFTRIDFAHSNGSPTIIDWKTGNAAEDDRSQLILYSLYAQDKWDWDPLGTNLAAVYLQPSLRIDMFKPSPDDIEYAKEQVKRSFNEMLALEPAFGAADIEAFPMTDNTSNCLWCRFRGVCEGRQTGT